MWHDSVYVDDVVMLREAIPEHDLAAGRIGRIAQVLRYDHFEVEFEKYENNQNIVVLKIPLKYDQVQVFRHETTLNDRGFWQLIEEAKARGNGDPEQEESILVDMLAERSIADIYIFGNLTMKYMWFAYRHEIWSAAIAIQGGACGDDDFEDFLGWLVAQGEKIYYDALRDPEVLVDLVEVKCDSAGWTYGDVTIGINFAYYDAYEKKTGEEIQFGVSYPECPTLMGPLWGEETIRQKYPKLSAKFWAGECNEESE